MDDIKELKESIQDLKVLFVDDEVELREGTGAFLKKFFEDVVICQDGEAGLNYCKENHIDIIITDLMMPQMDGLSMVKEIKKFSPEIFIILVTAFRESLEADSSLIDMHIKKPLSYEDMISILTTIAKSYEK